MTLALPLLAWWVLSGLWLAFHDATDAAQAWAREGGGPGAVIDPRARDALPLPDPAVLAAGVRRAQALAAGLPIASVELRSVGALPMLQFADASGDRAKVQRFEAATGQPWRGRPDPDAAAMASTPEVRQRDIYKSWHRGDVAGIPGRVLGAIAGAALLALALTGLLTYRRLW